MAKVNASRSPRLTIETIEKPIPPPPGQGDNEDQ